MKKIFFAVTACIACLTSVKGQMTKGNLFIGTTIGAATYNDGNYNFNYNSGNLQNQDDKKYSVTLAPSIGVFLTDHLVFGGNLGFGYTHEDNFITNSDNAPTSHDITMSNTTIDIGPFLRYYFFSAAPSKAAFYIQAQAAAGTGSGSTSEAYSSPNSSTNLSGTVNNQFVFSAGGGFGMTYLIQKNIGLDIGVDYLYNYNKFDNNVTSVTVTNGVAGAGANNSYKATEPANGIGISAGFHLLIP